MATYYWVGGTGTWNAVSTANWSLQSGGAGGAGVPTAVDDVIFNSQSSATSYTVTIDAGICRDWTLAGPATGSVTVAGTTTMTVAGSVAWATTGITRTFTNTITFTSTTTGRTVDFGNITLANSLTFNALGGGWAITRNLTSGTGNTLTLTAGTLDLRGYAITFGGVSSSNSNVRTLLIDATTTLTLTGTTAWSFQTTTNLTINLSAVTIIFNGSSTTFNAGNLTYNTLSFTNVGGGTWTITGNPTFTNLIFTSRNVTGTRTIRFGGNVTVTNLTLGSANQILRRLAVFSDLVGIRRTLTVTNLVTPLSDIDFQDIAIAGTVWSGTRLGDCGNNLNITFAPGRLIYWNLPAGGAVSAAAWALSSGGTASVNNFPLPQDTIIIQNTGLNTGATISVDTDWKFGTIDASQRTTAMTFSHGAVSFFIFGDLLFPSNVTLSGTTGSYIFAGQNLNINITSYLNNRAFPIQFAGANTTYTLQTTLNNTSVAGLVFNAGTLNLNGFDITTSRFTASASTNRTLNFGNNAINVTGNGNTIWNCSTTTGLAFTGNPVVNFTYSSNVGVRTVIQGILAGGNYPHFDIVAGSDTFTLSSSYYVGNLDFTGFSGTWTSTTSGFIADSLIVPPTTTIGAQGGTISFVSNTAPIKSIILSGKPLDQSIIFNGNGGSWALSDDIVSTVSRSITFSAGTLYANNKNITTGNVFFPNTSLAQRIVNMGSGTWTILGSSWHCNTSPTLLLNGNTSTLAFTNTTASITMNGGDQTYYNMIVPGLGGSNTNQFVNVGNNTFNDITLNLTPGEINRKVFIWASGDCIVRVNGTFTINNSSPRARPFFLNTTGNTTIVVNNAVGFDHIDFRRIILQGPITPLDGTRCGDCGGNQGINFAPSKTVYWSQPAGGNWSDNAWALTSGGTPEANAFPLTQDAVIIDANGTSNNISITIDRSWQLGDITIDTNNTINWVHANTTPDYNGSFLLANNVSVSGNGLMYFSPGRRSEIFVDFKNATIPVRADFQPILGGTVTLLSNTNIANTIGVVQGTLNINNNIVSCTNVFTSYTANRTIAFGNTGEILLTGANAVSNTSNTIVWNAQIANNLILTGSRTVRVTANVNNGLRGFNHGQTSGANELNSPDVYVEAGSDNFSYSTGNSASRDFIANVNFTGLLGIPITIYGNLTQSANCQPTSSVFTRFFAGTQGPYYIRLNGTSIDRPINFTGGAEYIFADNFVGNPNKLLWLFNGTITAQANVTVGGFAFWDGATDVPRTINMGNGVWTITGDSTSNLIDGGGGSVWQGGNTLFNTNLTVNPGNSTIRMTGAAHKRFNAGGKTYNNLVQAGTGNLRIQHEGKFNRISNEVDGTLVTFLENETHSVAEFALSNTIVSSVNQANVVPSNTFTLQARTGRQSVIQGVTIDHSIATPNGYFYAPTSNNNVNNGDNTGWKFESPKTNRAEFIPLIMPSF